MSNIEVFLQRVTVGLSSHPTTIVSPALYVQSPSSGSVVFSLPQRGVVIVSAYEDVNGGDVFSVSTGTGTDEDIFMQVDELYDNCEDAVVATLRHILAVHAKPFDPASSVGL